MIRAKIRSGMRVFDTPKLLLIFRNEALKMLSGFGAYTRTVARRSLRRKGKVSPPGSPPASHTKALKTSILFGVDRDRRSVVIGPVRLRGRKSVAHLVPPLLEYGGVTRSTKGRGKKMRYRARPFMGPAFQKSLPEVDRFWRSARS